MGLGAQLSKLFDSTKGQGFSKKAAVLFITGTVLPVAKMLGMSDEMVMLLGRLAGLYLGGQSLVDASHSFGKGRDENK